MQNLIPKFLNIKLANKYLLNSVHGIFPLGKVPLGTLPLGTCPYGKIATGNIATGSIAHMIKLPR